MNKINITKRDLGFFLLGIVSTLIISWFTGRKASKSGTSENHKPNL